MSADDGYILKELHEIEYYVENVWKQKRQRLVDMDFFCLDNSIRESTVGQLRSHTLQDKINIFSEIKKAGMTDIIVASFNNSTRVEDQFVPWLKEQGEDFSKFFSFSEVSEGLKADGTYDSETLPAGLRKNEQFGLYNVFFEADFDDDDCAWDTKYTVDDFCQLIKKRIDYVYEYASKIPNAKPRILLNIRDYPIAMKNVPERVLEVVKFLAELPEGQNMFALAFEDPLGEYLPEELEAWTASVRRTMDHYGWTGARLLAHIHQKWDLQTASALDVLGAGADGVWASLCEEGAALGHACSVTTMMNLIRLGNEKLLDKYNCTYFREAAINVTRHTTGKDPHSKVPIYGARSVDLVFGFIGIGDFDVAKFFGMDAPNRVTSLVTPQMLVDRLTKLFGANSQYEAISKKMKDQILKDLGEGIKEEYHSPPGIAMLFDRAGGKLTEAMADVLEKEKLCAVHHDNLIAIIRKEWDEWDLREEGAGRGDGKLAFDSFYHGFMSPYFSCYRCTRTKKGLQALDMNQDNYVDWKEFLVYIKWALRQYPDTEDPDILMDIVFQQGLIPAMQDELVKQGKLGKQGKWAKKRNWGKQGKWAKQRKC